MTDHVTDRKADRLGILSCGERLASFADVQKITPHIVDVRMCLALATATIAYMLDQVVAGRGDGS